MVTNELRKGDYVMLRNGWKARIEDNKKGNIRLCTVWGFYTEMGSVYSHDMLYKCAQNGDWLEDIEHTPPQRKLRRKVEEIMPAQF